MAGKRPHVGVLALQGDVREHARVLTDLGADVELVRRPSELAAVEGLVIPGGESSVIDKLSRSFGMQQPIRDAIASGMPILPMSWRGLDLNRCSTNSSPICV